MTGLLLAAGGGGFAVNWWEILIHVFNLIILIVFLKILVYKPVLSMIEGRQRKMAEIINENTLLEDEVHELAQEKEELEQEVVVLEHEVEELEQEVEELAEKN